VHGARHDAYAFEASGLKDILAGIHAAADLGYTGVEGIDVIPFKKPADGGSTICRRYSTLPSARSALRSSVASRI
jgi:hypothetical protein